eukprot:91942_1
MIANLTKRFNSVVLQINETKTEDEYKLIDINDGNKIRKWFDNNHRQINKTSFKIDKIVGTGTFGIVRIASIDLNKPLNNKSQNVTTKTDTISVLKVAVKQLSKKAILEYNQLP